MPERINPDFRSELRHYGLGPWNECYHCGGCTATCPLAEDNSLFPRRGIRLAQMGLEKSLVASVDPWLCYYCGDCSKTCPRGANPGELMMILRRYLTSRYDWTGVSRLFYRKKLLEILAILVMAAGVIISFLVLLSPAPGLTTNPEAFINQQGGVMINSLSGTAVGHEFVKMIEYGDLAMAAIVAFLLISNILHMFYRVILSDRTLHIPIFAYATELWQLIFNFATQARFSKCESKTYWIGHLWLMTGYTIMFIVIVGFLSKFQIEEIVPWYNWQRILGYYATVGLLLFITYTIVGRIRKKEAKMQFSHPSDWMFLILLLLTTITGILVHFFRITGLPAATYYTYALHLAVLVPMIVIEVPFSKWSHLAYRPFAIYFDRLRKAGLKKQPEPGIVSIIS